MFHSTRNFLLPYVVQMKVPITEFLLQHIFQASIRDKSKMNFFSPTFKAAHFAPQEDVLLEEKIRKLSFTL